MSKKVVRIVLLTLLCFHGFAQRTKFETSSNGYLMMIGGGISQSHADLFQRLAGGDDAKIGVIPSAMGEKEIRKDSSFSRIRKRFSKLGIEDIAIIHAKDRTEAESVRITAILKDLTGVFILGGDTRILVETYKGTSSQKGLEALLARGGIIAGTSAGSGVLSSFFTKDGLNEGFEWVNDLVVMNHFMTKDKLFTHQEDIQNAGKKLALGIDDATAVFVHGDYFEVVGSSYVAVFDGTQYHKMNDSIIILPPNSHQFYLLQNGDRYNLHKKVVANNARLEPLAISNSELKPYVGSFKSSRNSFSIDIKLKDGVLLLQNSWGWNEYPIYPFDDNIFFATNRNMWFRFKKDPVTGRVLSVDKMRSILQNKVINSLVRIK